MLDSYEYITTPDVSIQNNKYKAAHAICNDQDDDDDDDEGSVAP